MSFTLKRGFAIALAMVTGLHLLGGCGNPPADTTTTSQESMETKQEETKPKEIKTSLKVLTIGHSLAVDSGYMLSLIAAEEGYTELTVGTLYYSGCSLSRHVNFMSTDAREYVLYLSRSSDTSVVREAMESVTMGEAVRFMDWDVIVLQGSPFEVAEENTFGNGDIQKLQKFVNDNKLNPDAIFAWHMFWPIATDPELMATHPTKPNPYAARYAQFDTDRNKLYAAYTERVNTYIVTDETFHFVIPSGTAIENAMSGYMTEKDLLRDYGHATDLGRLIAGYTWYCTLRGIDALEEIKLGTVPKAYFKSTVSAEDWVLTDHEKALILESVNNALKNPLQVTPSRFTEAPIQ